MGPAQMTNTIAEGQTAFVPTWVSAFSTDPESNELLPAQWGMVGHKLQEAMVLGYIIKNNEFSAKVGDGSFIEDVTHRELLIKACKQAQESMRQMTQQSPEEKFEQLCSDEDQKKLAIASFVQKLQVETCSADWKDYDWFMKQRRGRRASSKKFKQDKRKRAAGTACLTEASIGPVYRRPSAEHLSCTAMSL